MVTILYYWDKMELFNIPSKPVHFRTMHRCFYEITVALFGTFLPFYVFKKPILVIPIFIGIFLFIEGIYQVKLRKYFELRWDFTKALLHDTEGFYRSLWKPLFTDPDPDFRKIIVKQWKEGKKLNNDFRSEV